MTREEAINYIKSSGVRIRMTRTEAINYLKSSGMSDKQIETVINAFTCNDCISREAVHDLIATWLSDYLLDDTREVLEVIDEKVEDLPSVIPKEIKD